MNEAEKVRVDKYLWAIRLFKTRADASVACERGKVKCGGTPVKAAKKVSPGDEYEIKTDARKWVIRVTGLIQNRVAYSEAIKNYLDITPEEEKGRIRFAAASFNTGKRLSKLGRPTKKQKRDLDAFMGSPDEDNQHEN